MEFLPDVSFTSAADIIKGNYVTVEVLSREGSTFELTGFSTSMQWHQDHPKVSQDQKDFPIQPR